MGSPAAPDTLEAAILLQRQGTALGRPASQARSAAAVPHRHAADSMRPAADSIAPDSNDAITEGLAQAAQHSRVQTAQQPPEGLGNSEQQSVAPDRASVGDASRRTSKDEFQQPAVGPPSFPSNSQVAGNSQLRDKRSAPEDSREGPRLQEGQDPVQCPRSERGCLETDDWREEQRLWLTSPSGLSVTAGLLLKPESAASTAPPSRAESRTSAGNQAAGFESKSGRPRTPAKVGLPRCSVA